MRSFCDVSLDFVVVGVEFFGGCVFVYFYYDVVVVWYQFGESFVGCCLVFE